MAKVTWLGDKEVPDLKETTRWGIKFEKDKAVDVDNPLYLGKLKANKSFKIEGQADTKHPEVLDPVLHRPPSEMSAQGPVDKPGEPVAPKIAAYEPPPDPPPEGSGDPMRSTRTPLAPPPKIQPKRP